MTRALLSLSFLFSILFKEIFMEKSYRFKIVRIVDGKMEMMDFIGTVDNIPSGWFFPMRRIKEPNKTSHKVN